MVNPLMNFNLPDVGEGLTEAEIVKWCIDEGDGIQAGDPMVVIETDKAVVDIPAPESGILKKKYAAAGDIVTIGKPLAQLEIETTHREPTRSQESVSVVGDFRNGKTQIVENATAIDTRTSPAVKIMPAVRALATKLDVDLALITPTGRNGTITRIDVDRVAKRLHQFGPPEKLRGTRRAMAIAMSRSHAEVAPATLMDEIDVQHWTEDTDITCRLLRAIMVGCKSEPALNTWYDAHAMTRRVFEKVDIALAMDTVEGLFTPVLRDVAALSDSDIRTSIEQIKTDVEQRSISRDILRDYTITLSNYGTLSGRFAVAVVVPPTVAIVGSGKIYRGLAVFDDQPSVRKFLPLSLTFDHRAVTGAEAGRFLEAMKTTLMKDED